ncbi:MAG TPA: WD40 repeat domain-containing protein [Capsulimonadaceae bacterium]
MFRPAVRLLLRIAVAIIVFISGACSYAQTATAAAPGFALLWRKVVPPLRDLAISPQGTRLVLLTADNKLAVWDANPAKPLWSKPNVDGSSIAISDGVGYAALYDLMNPDGRSIDLYDATTGKLTRTEYADGAIWDVVVSDSGDYLCYGTGTGSLYVCTLDMHPSSQRIKLRGVCNSLALSPDDSYVAVGLWNESGVDWMDLAGKTISSQAGEATKRYEPVIAQDGSTIAGLQYDNHQRRNPTLTLWRKSGEKLWSYAIGKDALNARALVAKGGQFVVVSYFKQIVRDHVLIPERRLLMLDETGKQVFQIGGLYLSLTLMFISPDNHGFVAYDGDRTLYRFDHSGNAVRTWPLTSAIRAWAVTSDGKRLIVHTTDNQLALLSVN